jgi:hypothetical protein
MYRVSVWGLNLNTNPKSAAQREIDHGGCAAVLGLDLLLLASATTPHVYNPSMYVERYVISLESASNFLLKTIHAVSFFRRRQIWQSEAFVVWRFAA